MNTLKENTMTAIRAIKSEFSAVNGSKVRIVRDIRGSILGTITKTEDGYRVTRVDGRNLSWNRHLNLL